ncbi:MAG: hypothetical protein ABI963_08320 [Rhizomicrobium sp.]
MPMSAAQISPQRLRPGTVVTVQMKGLFKLAHHFALVSDKMGPDAMPMVIANSGETRGPGEQSWSGFVKGREYRAFYPSALPSKTVLTNAYSMFGTRYNFLHWNCEHFANACHGRPAQSHQLRGGLMLAALMGGLMLAAART